jgi:alpha-tubulin suppressor-like RCC1 family protein
MKQSIAALAVTGLAWGWMIPLSSAQSEPVKRLSAGDHHNLVLRLDGTLWAWGSNSAGQLGRGSTADSGTPVAVSFGSGGGLTENMSGGRAHSLAARPDGTSGQAVWSWGENATQQLGIHGSTADRSSPVYAVRADGSRIYTKQLSGGGDHTVGINGSGKVLSWGSNLYGQLGYGVVDTTAPTYRSEPVLVRINSTTDLSNVVAVRAGRHHSLALTSGGMVYAWGRNNRLQLGNGTSDTASVPWARPVKRYVDGVLQNLSGVIDIATGHGHSAALLDNGTVFAWGADDMGQLGNAGGADPDRTVAGAVYSNGVTLTGIVAIASGGNHLLALHGNGEVYAWGNNTYGQLGDGSTGTTRFQAVKVLKSSGVALGGVSEIAAGARHSIALANDQVHTWGDNAYGQLGKGTVGGAVAPYAEARNLFTNTPPVANAVTATTDEDSACAVVLSGSDPEGKPLTFQIVTAPAASAGSLSGTAPNLTFTPALNYHGTVSFTYKVNDGQHDSPPATVTITVNPINDPPVADSKLLRINEDGAGSIEFTGSDIEGSSLSFSLDYVLIGSISVSGRTATFNPDADYYGETTFSYKAWDGEDYSLPALVQVIVQEVNDPPICGNDSIIAKVNSSAEIPIGILVANDQPGPVNENEQTLSITGVSNISAAGGAVSINAGIITYEPPLGFAGYDSFTYSVQDNGITNGQSDPKSSTGTVTVFVKYDFDNDGLKDVWEIEHFGEIETYNKSDDPDQDGLSNISEYEGGTDPKDYYNGNVPSLTIISGNHQEGYSGQLLSSPFVVKVRDLNGNALNNAPVTFSVEGEGALVRSESAGEPKLAAITVRANALGEVSNQVDNVYFLLPSNTSAQPTSIRAKAGAASVVFNAGISSIPKGLIAYDGFDYDPLLAIKGRNQGSGWGVNVWQSDSNLGSGSNSQDWAGIKSGNLLYTGIGAKGNRLQTSGKSAWRMIGDSSRIGKDQSSVWISFLLKKDTSTQPMRMELRSGSVPKVVVNANYNQQIALQIGGQTVSSGMAANNGADRLIVLRIDYSAAGQGKAYLWVDPRVDHGVEPKLSQAVTLNGSNLHFDTTFFYSAKYGTHQWDELKIASSFFVAVGQDADSDGIPDVWENSYGLNYLRDDSTKDNDGDGLSNLAEYQAGTSPLITDTDMDGIGDYQDHHPLDYYNQSIPVVSIMQGNYQDADTNVFLEQPLVVSVHNGTGQPLANAPIRFEVKFGDGQIGPNTNSTLSSLLETRTDSAGIARVA